MFASLPQLVVTLNLIGAALFVASPTYFTPAQYDRPLVVAEAKVVLGAATSAPTATPTATPSATATPLPLVEEVVIPATMDTPYGPITYTKILKDVWAVSYDSSCLGCNATTATGMRQGYGVVAVDPKVIPLYTRVYVPGYGIGVAGDVGGAVKGKIIDLGYDKLEGQWSARYVDVYVLAE
ncbi:MAG: 3D domain-containing protein [Candidatus Chisholmbacteria bacterium]|nr:3D domain-containing protein [Candidatus Chisholmbacteria bacterium]